MLTKFGGPISKTVKALAFCVWGFEFLKIMFLLPMDTIFEILAQKLWEEIDLAFWILKFRKSQFCSLGLEILR